MPFHLRNFCLFRDFLFYSVKVEVLLHILGACKPFFALLVISWRNLKHLVVFLWHLLVGLIIRTVIIVCTIFWDWFVKVKMFVFVKLAPFSFCENWLQCYTDFQLFLDKGYNIKFFLNSLFCSQSILVLVFSCLEKFKTSSLIDFDVYSLFRGLTSENAWCNKFFQEWSQNKAEERNDNWSNVKQNWVQPSDIS